MRKLGGFTLNELMISVFILGLIAAASVVNLRTARQRDELDAAVRVIAADLRSLQSRALSAQNVLSCSDSMGTRIVCEESAVDCVGACSAIPPLDVGAYFRSGTSMYTLFAEVEPTKNDWTQTDPTEVFYTRDLTKNGGTFTQISSLDAGGVVGSANVSFQRQSGSLGVNGCYTPCVSPVTLVITVRHTLSNASRTISVNAYTGRISID